MQLGEKKDWKEVDVAKTARRYKEELLVNPSQAALKPAVAA